MVVDDRLNVTAMCCDEDLDETVVRRWADYLNAEQGGH
jgi:hypothetical protein